MHWRRKWQPPPVLLPGESQGQGAWWAAISGVAELDMTELMLQQRSIGIFLNSFQSCFFWTIQSSQSWVMGEGGQDSNNPPSQALSALVRDFYLSL